jgi:hypothetical protein
VGNCPYRLGRSESEGGLLPSLLCRISDENKSSQDILFTPVIVHAKPLHEFFREEAAVKRSSREVLTELSKRPAPLPGMIACHRLHSSISAVKTLFSFLLTNHMGICSGQKCTVIMTRNGRNYLYYSGKTIIGLCYHEGEPTI